jgi:hypothetical protein
MLFKIRTKRAKLPYGRYCFSVIISCRRFYIFSAKYDLYASKKNLVKLTGNRVNFKIHESLIELDLDELEDTLNRMCLGKFRITYNSNKEKPIEVFLTHKEDLFVFFMHYDALIFKIYEFKPKLV